MIRNFLVLLIFLGIGFGAGVAQSDIFVRQAPKKEQSQDNAEQKKQKKSIFLRPFTSGSRSAKRQQNALKNRYGARLNTDGVRNKLVQDLNMLAYWQQNKRMPEGLTEMQAYATALRAENLASVLVRRNKIVPSLLKSHNDRFAALDKQRAKIAPDRAAIDAANAAILEAMEAMEEPNAAVEAVYTSLGGQDSVSAIRSGAAEEKPGVRSTIRKIMPIYRRQETKSDDEASPANRVYKNYR